MIELAMQPWMKDVNPKLVEFVEQNIFPEYQKNDKGHGILHILEVIRRSFELNELEHLNLDPNMIFAIAACHDNGKYEDHKRHHIIAAERFRNTEGFRDFFDAGQIKTIADAIEDHRSSKEDEPRSEYGKLISSADRNSTIKIVFIRSFFVAHERLPEMQIEQYLDYTIDRLRKKYDEKDPENMFYQDKKYKQFLKEMRALLKDEKAFKQKYCEVNHITNRNARVCDEPGCEEYSLQK